ncbi:aspartate aminotransferase family protein [Desulfovibrio litoralis]|uniref:Acetylornithine aminotransferase n=1 Tax=Desulfovibrio litoralis DSM 11393 TaxID=1121455 RepID=A0A1M7SL11_9BACT|nr:aspartate aminotransferase family protein [Desulfovibrio litoralis]SHN59150.1 acetylornithine aminotransferase apoenzyme [Desulfovibrio litoralis DSM 11393]
MSQKFDELKQQEETLLCRTYGRYPIAVSHGKGSRLYDFDGKEYIDLLTGIAVTALGHANEEISQVIEKQARKLTHVSNLFYQEEQLILAKNLLSTAHFNKAFFCNSGAEANEAAIKLARRYQQRVKMRDAYEIITFTGCFHGRTLATVAATGQEKFQDGFSPMPEGFKQIEWGDLELLEKTISPKTAGILIEIIQGEGGIRPVTETFIKGIETLCRKHGLAFMVDEVQTGLCRTGKFWAFQNFNVTPDILTTAKALANGLPMGAMICTEEFSQGFVTGSHATTFGAGALVSAVANKGIEIMKRDKLADRAAKLGKQAMERFKKVSQNCPGKIKEIRGLGLMIGIELTFQGKEVWEELMKQGFILNLTQEKVLRLLPALTIDDNDLELFANALEKILKTK